MAEMVSKEVVEPTFPGVVSASAIQKKAEEIKKQRELPPKPGNKVSFRDLVNWLQLLTPEMEERLLIYVYRHEPVIIRQMVDPTADNNIDVISDGFTQLTEQYFIDRHGGGKYGMVIKDSDTPKHTKGGFFEATLNIPTSQYPPKLNLKEVDWEHKSNKGYRAWAKAQGLIDDNGVPIMQAQGLKKEAETGNSNADVVSMMKLAMDFATKMSDKQQAELKKQLGAEDALGKSIGDIFLEKMKQEDPSKQLNMVTTLLTAMKSMQPAPPQDNTLTVVIPMFMKMMETQQANSDKQFQLMIELMKKETPAQETDELDKLQKLLLIAKEIKGGNSNPDRNWVDSLIENLGPAIAPAIGAINNFMILKAQAGNPNAATPPVQTGVTNANTTPATPPNFTTQQQTVIANNQMTKEEMIIKQFTPNIINALGQEGCLFADWIAQGFGELTVKSITNYGEEKLLNAAKKVPELWETVQSTYGEEHFKKWLHSFVNFEEELAKLEQGEGEEENGN